MAAVREEGRGFTRAPPLLMSLAMRSSVHRSKGDRHFQGNSRRKRQMSSYFANAVVSSAIPRLLHLRSFLTCLISQFKKSQNRRSTTKNHLPLSFFLCWTCKTKRRFLSLHYTFSSSSSPSFLCYASIHSPVWRRWKIYNITRRENGHYTKRKWG